MSSYLLIGFDHEQEKARKAALQALFVTGGGGLALLAGLLLLGEVAGTLQLSALGAQAGAIQAHALYLPVLLLVLLGAFTKSAQFPFHFWLPGRHGRAQPGERVPALGHDGEGGDLPPRPPQPGPRRNRRLALPRHPGRHRDTRHRGRPRLRPDRPQAPAGLHDVERARHADRPRGHLDRALGPGGDGVPARPRPLQGGALPGGGGDRPRGGNARREAPRRARESHAADRLRRDRLRAVDGGAAPLLRLRGEGAVLRGEAGSAASGGPPRDRQLRGERPRGGGGRARGLAAVLREAARDTEAGPRGAARPVARPGAPRLAQRGPRPAARRPRRAPRPARGERDARRAHGGRAPPLGRDEPGLRPEPPGARGRGRALRGARPGARAARAAAEARGLGAGAGLPGRHGRDRRGGEGADAGPPERRPRLVPARHHRHHGRPGRLRAGDARGALPARPRPGARRARRRSRSR